MTRAAWIARIVGIVGVGWYGCGSNMMMLHVEYHHQRKTTELLQFALFAISSMRAYLSLESEKQDGHEEAWPQDPKTDGPVHKGGLLPCRDENPGVVPGEPFVYGAVGDELWFMPLRTALEWAFNHAVLKWGTTWGDLRTRLSGHEAHW